MLSRSSSFCCAHMKPLTDYSQPKTKKTQEFYKLDTAPEHSLKSVYSSEEFICISLNNYSHSRMRVRQNDLTPKAWQTRFTSL